MSIKVSVEAQKLLQAADDRASGLPSPSSKWYAGKLENFCGDCGHHPVEGPDARYRCPACGKTADEYKCLCQHVAEVDAENGYPETELAVALVQAARNKPASQKSKVDSELADAVLTADAEVTDDPIGGTRQAKQG